MRRCSRIGRSRMHMEAFDRLGFSPIDLVVVNLYPFEATIARAGVTPEEAIENIDIGGPSMIRSAAKNAALVAVVVSPSEYPAILAELREQRRGAERGDPATVGPAGVSRTRRPTTRRSRTT